MYSIRVSRSEDAVLLPAIERSAGQAFLAIADLAYIVTGEVQSVDDHLQLIAEGYSVVAVNEDDQPIGFINGERQDGALHIWELAVALEYQKAGIGRALIAHSIEVAKSQGLTAVTLTTFKDVSWNQPFYQRLGFQLFNSDEIPLRLQQILACEVVHGLPGERRCAMQYSLAVIP